MNMNVKIGRVSNVIHLIIVKYRVLISWILFSANSFDVVGMNRPLNMIKGIASNPTTGATAL